MGIGDCENGELEVDESDSERWEVVSSLAFEVVPFKVLEGTSGRPRRASCPTWKFDFRQRTSSYARALPLASFLNKVVFGAGSGFTSRSGGFLKNVNSLVGGFVPPPRTIFG